MLICLVVVIANIFANNDDYFTLSYHKMMLEESAGWRLFSDEDLTMGIYQHDILKHRERGMWSATWCMLAGKCLPDRAGSVADGSRTVLITCPRAIWQPPDPH